MLKPERHFTTFWQSHRMIDWLRCSTKGGTASEGGEIEREERSGNVNSINSMEQRRKNCQHAGANGNLRCLNNNIREDAKLAKFFNNKLAWEEMSGADGDEMKWRGCRGCCQKDSF